MHVGGKFLIMRMMFILLRSISTQVCVKCFEHLTTGLTTVTTSHLVYRGSDIFASPNALSTNVSLHRKGKSPVQLAPEGITHPAIFLKVASTLNKLANDEIKHGGNPEFVKWKGKSQAFQKSFKNQLTAYARSFFPFNDPVDESRPVRDWWLKFKGTPNAGILAVS